MDLSDLNKTTITNSKGEEVEFLQAVLEARKSLYSFKTNEGELAAFVSYAQSNPKGFLALVDTYDVMKSGVPNFLSVAVALFKTGGYTALGIRLDSGDLAAQSKWCRNEFKRVGSEFC